MRAKDIEWKLRETYANRCNPDEPLRPDDERNVDIDELNPDARGVSVVDTIAERIEISKSPVCELFSGLPGSGKSTELRRLVARLAAPTGAHLLPVIIDAEETLDTANPIDVADILIAILYHTERALLIAEGATAEAAARDALSEGRLRRLWHWVTHLDLEIKSIEFATEAKAEASELGELSASAKAEFELRSDPSLRRRIREKIAAHMTTFLREMKILLRAMEARAKKLGRRGLLIVVDSLEKLRGSSDNWVEVLRSAEHVFRGNAPYLQLPVHVLYTVPPAVVLRISLRVHFLPMLKLHDRAGKRCDGGFDAAWQIVHQRVPDSVLEVFFGSSWVARINRLIEWSGGYPREIVQLLQTFLSSSREIDEPRFDRVISLAADQHRRTLPDSAFRWLAQVHLEKRLVIEDDEQRETVDLMLQNNVVLRYQNNDPWADVHPAVLEMPQVAAAIAQLRRERDVAPSGA